MDASQKDETTVSIFRDRTLSFYRIISHPDVLSSLILETPVDTIYTFLFGPSGRRGLRAFRFITTALSGMILGHSSSDEGVSTIAISSSLAVLDQLIEINQSAQVIEGFIAIVGDNLCLHFREFHGTECTTKPHSNQTSSQHRLFVASRTNPINSAKPPICSLRVESRLAWKFLQQWRSTR
jgi:hypothetical protein